MSLGDGVVKSESPGLTSTVWPWTDTSASCEMGAVWPVWPSGPLQGDEDWSGKNQKPEAQSLQHVEAEAEGSARVGKGNGR